MYTVKEILRWFLKPQLKIMSLIQNDISFQSYVNYHYSLPLFSFALERRQSHVFQWCLDIYSHFHHLTHKRRDLALKFRSYTMNTGKRINTCEHRRKFLGLITTWLHGRSKHGRTKSSLWLLGRNPPRRRSKHQEQERIKPLRSSYREPAPDENRSLRWEQSKRGRCQKKWIRLVLQ